MPWKVPPLWEGGECWILGGGPSLPKQFDIPDQIIRDVISGKRSPSDYSPFMAAIHDKHCIAVNNSYMIGDWIEVMHFGDCNWFTIHRNRLARFPGLKTTSCHKFKRVPKDGIKFLNRDRSHSYGIASDPTLVSWNQNSGASAISVARHLGVKRIILVGFDMSLDKSNRSHWHGLHGNGKPGHYRTHPPFKRHLRGFEYIARDAERMGIEIINASPESEIPWFPKVNVKDLIKKDANHESRCA